MTTASLQPLVAMKRSAALEAVFMPVEAATAFDATVKRLGTAIRLGLLPARSRLPPERDLAEELRINRSTLREALRALMASGHLVSLRGPSGGTFVADAPPLALSWPDKPTSEGVLAVLDQRLAVETGAVVLAAERAMPNDLRRLEGLVQRMADAEAFHQYRRADMHFHIAVAEAAHSPKLVATMTDVQGQMSDLIAGIPHPKQVLTRSNAQHRRLVALLRTRDTGRAVRLMRKHIERTENVLKELWPPRGRGDESEGPDLHRRRERSQRRRVRLRS
jgi:GntR family transcriptional repressor for pyruvate dehydrogenase complex